MGLFGDIVSGVGNALSTVGKVVGGVIEKIGVSAGGFAGKFIGIASKVPWLSKIGTVIQVIEIAARIIHTIATVLEIVLPDEKPEELGMKAEQSDKTIEDFDGDVEAYIKHLREEIELDEQKMNELSKDERAEYRVIGMALETKAVEQKIGGVEITPESVLLVSKLDAEGVKITAEKIIEVIKVLKEAGITNMNDVVDYFEGKGTSDRLKTGAVLREAIGENAYERIAELKEAVRK